MLKVVLDTNVVISSAISSDGNPASIFEMLLLEEIQNFTTEEIIEEIKEVLERPRITKRLSLIEREFILNNFIHFSTTIKPAVRIEEIKDDPDDNKFLECAVSAKADYIISGDEHLLKVNRFKGILIVTPAEFVSIVD
ncbi:MAG: putative toxin-antitoxin system toxin component, PIN family [Nanoarchaeota archaeon]|nr:putative toxin-antitoxin system toxin component, PIN family [Nanoarchaeota archaeon]MBU1622901.1 putative toxin-antitoxin system toxin component, PIN family [Nanoarchaeota archaeon]MBU1974257.1 putative toxin-antitoxin system toxin component, PIN family [Nanoarchaeota archaeon]